MENECRFYDKSVIFSGYICKMERNRSGCKFDAIVQSEVIACKVGEDLFQDIETDRLYPTMNTFDYDSDDCKNCFFALPLKCFTDGGKVSRDELVENSSFYKEQAKEISRIKAKNDYEKPKRRIRK